MAEPNKFIAGFRGRPPVYSDAFALARKIEEFFTYIQGESHIERRTVTKKDKETKEVYEEEVDVTVWDRLPEQPNITNLALFLGFESRQSFYDYGSKPEFSYTIKRARFVIENHYENHLLSDTATGAIFALKNFGWIDKQSLEHTGKDGEPIQTQNKNEHHVYFHNYAQKSDEQG